MVIPRKIFFSVQAQPGLFNVSSVFGLHKRITTDVFSDIKIASSSAIHLIILGYIWHAEGKSFKNNQPIAK